MVADAKSLSLWPVPPRAHALVEAYVAPRHEGGLQTSRCKMVLSRLGPVPLFLERLWKGLGVEGQHF